MRRLRITLRDLFWLTLVAALAVGWYIDHRAKSWVARQYLNSAGILYAELGAKKLEISQLQRKLTAVASGEAPPIVAPHVEPLP